MAKVTTCDGCGKPIEGEVREVGFVLKREYCETCHDAVSEYLQKVDALHDRLIIAWRDDLASLREEYRTKLNQLPDDQVAEVPA